MAVYAYQNYLTLLPKKCLFWLSEIGEVPSEGKKIYHRMYDFPFSRPLLRKCETLSTSLNYQPNKNGFPTFFLSLKCKILEKLKNVHLALNPKRGKTSYHSCIIPLESKLKEGKSPWSMAITCITITCKTISTTRFSITSWVFWITNKGWGCAYRSLQSVLSWFIEQSYVPEFQMPTHKEIQQMLISLGDKPKEFLGENNTTVLLIWFTLNKGTSEWIGAFEVNLILGKMLNVNEF